MSNKVTQPAELIKLNDIQLANLHELDNSALSRALHRILDTKNCESEPIAGFSQSIAYNPEPSRHQM
jgi:FXSXX-COOH protein